MGKDRWGRFFCLPSQTSGLACQALLLIAAPREGIKFAGHLPQPCREARCRHHWQRGRWLFRPVVMPAVDAAPPAAIKRRADEVGSKRLQNRDMFSPPMRKAKQYQRLEGWPSGLRHRS